ncbi:MAG: beta-N-acetylhexosaminidase [Flavobacteriaceae bacterium]|nr:beta-N-acetylhexosaminidase [Flavobacteriaceae bacterium]
MKKTKKQIYLAVLIFTLLFSNHSIASELSDLDLHIIPYPQKVQIGGDKFVLQNSVNIVLDKNHSKIDWRTAEYLRKELQDKWGLVVSINEEKGGSKLILTRKGYSKSIGEQGYELSTGANVLTIRAKGEDGLFYGVQTLFQLIKKSRGVIYIPGMKITDWPDVNIRAVHYDTKHHQDKGSYVKSFIRDLAKYKINMLVWEWEDKLAYKSHPKIGAPGAFTIEEMKEFTLYAREHHIELVPLVQGLGHVSFILKWNKFKHLREVADSDWEFCPLKEGTYDLLFDLWDEAIEATPGSKYIHIGSDETFELGECKECRAKAKEIGNSGLYHLFANKASKHLKKSRKVMLWERPMGWRQNSSPIKNMKIDTDLVLTESYENYRAPDFRYAKEAKSMGFEVFMYDPNPGLEPLFLPYHFKKHGDRKVPGSLKNSYDLLSTGSKSKAFDGMINTSWDDSGLHNQMWMLSFVASAQYSWNGASPTPEEFENSFFASYYGNDVMNMQELYELLNDGAYYYAATFERNIWHHGEIGKTHLPDLPRSQYIEYDPYWNTEYKTMIIKSKRQRKKMARALQIIEANKLLDLDNSYDFEVYQSIANLIDHTCQTYLDLSKLEYTITEAHRNAFSDREAAYNSLLNAEKLIENSLARRERVYSELVAIWEKTRLPKGMSTPSKKFFYKMDRSRHFANRTPDLSYLIYDEQLLDIEGYLKRLKKYRESFQIKF